MKKKLFFICLALFACEDKSSDQDNRSTANFNIYLNEDTGENYYINPFDVAPMVAGINFLYTDEVQNSEIEASVSIKSTVNQIDFTKAYSFKPDTSTQWLPIIGMYEGDNEVHVKVKEKINQNVLHDTTYTIKINIPEGKVGRAREANISGSFPDDEMIFLLYNTSMGRVRFTGFVFDILGNIRWYSDIPNSFMQFVIDGILYVGFKGEKIHSLEAYDFLGRKLNKWDLPGYEDVHHDVIKNEMGNLILTVSSDDASPVEDKLIELSPNSIQDNKVVNSIDLSVIFPNVDELFPDLPQLQIGGTREDHVHNNSVSYYKRNGQSVFICSSQRSGIAAVDENGYPHWYFFPKNVQYSNFEDSSSSERLPASGSFPSVDYSDPPSYSKLLVDPINSDGSLIIDSDIINYGKVKEGSDFIFPFRQHGARVIEYGENHVTFLVLDNALFQGLEKSRNDARSRAVCYKVAFQNSNQIYGGTIEQLWSTEMDFFSPFLGDSRKTQSGYIFTFGSIGSTALSVGDDFDYRNELDSEMRSLIIELDNNGKEVARLIIPSTDQGLGVGTYRAQRINL